jgi:hypothetical protein
MMCCGYQSNHLPIYGCTCRTLASLLYSLAVGSGHCIGGLCCCCCRYRGVFPPHWNFSMIYSPLYHGKYQQCSSSGVSAEYTIVGRSGAIKMWRRLSVKTYLVSDSSLIVLIFHNNFNYKVTFRDF